MAFVNCKTFFEKLNELKVIVQNVANNQQGKLLNCEGNPLEVGSKVPTCDAMKVAIDEKAQTLIEQNETYANGKISALENSLPENAHFNNWIKGVLLDLGFKADNSNPSKPTLKVDLSGLVDGTSIKVENDKLSVLSKPCRAKVKMVQAGYHILPDDEVLIVHGGGAIHVPRMDLGREVMIVQAGVEQVVLQANGTELIAPFSGSLKLAGKNATVSLLASDDNAVRVFGQTVGI